MRKAAFLLLTLGLSLTLAACGAGDDLTAENQAYQEKITELEQENADLTAENAELKAQSAAMETPETDDRSDNPIDRCFDENGYWKEITTPALNLVTQTYEDAWHAELTACANAAVAGAKTEDDRDLAAEYLENAENQAETLLELTYLFRAGPDIPKDERIYSAGAEASFVITANQARAYRNAFYSLFSADPAPREWVFVFDADAVSAQLDAALGK